ncbi:helix-turn-helix transcriptional regulator [Corynebacterium guangdongense]|uniref:ArsR family transcriptional regulator n=1 Tax=Corynebacterium guangdongense TaxID=1783348 RepID=A0ABU1ZVY8_9CORY|nr:transcriptional regulator [Corynebacterium guangdongense]MDR7329089.1 putative ArsR family transcriptional regulator [Corynebacterium guangdongense]WJZ17658.1 LexA DNA binding domain protein [Corynebacterium guangdongense]
MPQHTPPRPATELFPESLNLSPKQREVLNVLQGFDGGARAVDIANALNMHVNTARGHLDELESKGAVRVETAAAKGRGRPSLIFHVRVPDNREIANEYVSLIEVLTEIVSNQDSLSPASLEMAREIGRKWAAEMREAENPDSDLHNDQSLEVLNSKLRAMGFDPVIREADAHDTDTVIGLNSCPFITEDGELPSPFVCAMHEGFITETAGRRRTIKLTPFDAHHQCGVHLDDGQATAR